jgi:hypothetical protein
MSSTVWCMPCLIVLPCCAQSATWRRAIRSPCTVAVPDKWPTGPALHYSRTVATCPHVLQTLIVLSTRTSCRPMMALTSGALETCARALGTCGSSRTGRSARLSFMFEAHGPQGTAGHAVVAPEPSR